MGRKKTDSAISAEKKNAILDAALEYFTANGFSGARIETIAKSAGLSYGAVYYHYPSKDILLHMTVQRSIEESMALFQKVDDSLSALEQLRTYTDAFLAWAGTNHGAQSLLLFYQVLTAKNTPDITRIYLTEKTTMIYDNIDKIMEKLHDAGLATNKTARELTTMFQALMIGYAFQRISKLDTSVPNGDALLDFLK